MSADLLLAEAERSGITICVTDHGTLKLRGPAPAVALLQPKFAEAKPRIIEELHRRNAEAIESEWRVDHDQFIVARAPSADEKAVCLACGGTWELHGKPPREKWHLVDDIELVEHFAAGFVLLTAERIASEARER